MHAVAAFAARAHRKPHRRACADAHAFRASAARVPSAALTSCSAKTRAATYPPPRTLAMLPCGQNFTAPGRDQLSRLVRGGASAARAARAKRPRGGTREARGEVRFWVLVAVLVALLSQVGRRARLARFIGRSRCALARALRQRGRGGPMRRACARRH